MLDKAIDVVQKQSDAFREYLHVARLCQVALISIPASKDKCVREALATAIENGSVVQSWAKSRIRCLVDWNVGQRVVGLCRWDPIRK